MRSVHFSNFSCIYPWSFSLAYILYAFVNRIYKQQAVTWCAYLVRVTYAFKSESTVPVMPPGPVLGLPPTHHPSIIHHQSYSAQPFRFEALQESSQFFFTIKLCALPTNLLCNCIKWSSVVTGTGLGFTCSTASLIKWHLDKSSHVFGGGGNVRN